MTPTWALLIAMHYAITGFASRADCIAAAKAAEIPYVNYVCAPVPAGGDVLGRGSGDRGESR